MEIAFIGLGNMGSGMAANITAAGHRVRAFDLSEPALEQGRQNGCTIMRSVAEAVVGAEAVVSMLPNGEIVRAVYEGEVFPHARPGTLFVECSTIDLATARALTADAEAGGFAMVDAPASGGIAGAKAGALTFMVGGGEESFVRAEAVLAPMAKAVIHAGASGCGQIAKMANNMLLAIHMIGTCEALALASKAGLDPQVFQSIASKATGACWSLNDYTRCPASARRARQTTITQAALRPR